MTADIALVHDVLGARAGGERVLLALARIFPQAMVYTLLHEPNATFEGFEGRQVVTSWLQRSAWLRRNYRAALPVAAPTYSFTKVDAHVTICSTSGLSHHVRTTGAKVVYCHTPARWLHDTDTYLSGFGAPLRTAVKAVAPAYKQMDKRAMASADRVVANSHQVAAEIAEIYGIKATVISPCSSLSIDGPVQPIPGVESGFVLSPARPLGYKRLDVLVDAARQLPDLKVIQVGEGPHRQALLDTAPANFQSVGTVSDAQLRWAYRHAHVVALTCAEDFGLVPLEAAAHGVHTVAPNARGMLDHNEDMMTRYRFTSVPELVAAITAAPPPTGYFDAQHLGVERFAEEINEVVADVR